ncbi:MAG: hypothetical protein AAFV53_38735 [Myxococcota bacterium]
MSSSQPPLGVGLAAAWPQPAILQPYTALVPQLPAIQWIPRWQAWVGVDGGVDPAAVAALDDYREEVPLFVTVDDNYVEVRERGTGGGDTVWRMARFVPEHGAPIIVWTWQDADPTYPVGGWTVLDADPLLPLPLLQRADFFDEAADQDIINKHALISLEMILPRYGNQIRVNARPLPDLRPRGDGVADAALPKTEAQAILATWQMWRWSTILLRFDPAAGRFFVQERRVLP